MARRKSKTAAVVTALPLHVSVADAEWRPFVRQWLEHSGCQLSPAARGDWEVTLSPGLARRWRRRRVRLVFDPSRPSLPRGAWFSAPGSAAGQRLLEAAREESCLSRRTALPKVPGAPPEGFASVCRLRGLRWGEARLGPVRYVSRVALHLGLSLWGGLPEQEHWVLVTDDSGEPVERASGRELGGLRSREGWPPHWDAPDLSRRAGLWSRMRAGLEGLLTERQAEWEQTVTRQRDEELRRLRGFFAARLSEEEERARRRQPGADEAAVNGGDATSIKLEWDRRSAEVEARWAVRLEARLWGIVDWAWPVAELDQELRAGAMHVRLRGRVDVARGLPGLPACPGCARPAELLVRSHGGVGCVHCAA